MTRTIRLTNYLVALIGIGNINHINGDGEDLVL